MKRVRRGIGIDPSCPICGHNSEDVLHLHIDCSAAKDIWLNVIMVNQQRIFFSNNLHDLLVSNSQDFSKMHDVTSYTQPSRQA